MGKAGSNRGRVKARRCAVQALYQWHIGETSPADIVAEFVADRELINVDVDYFRELVEQIPQHVGQLQADIVEALDRDWDRLDPVARAVLLVGAYEIRFCAHIPWRVVVNEGVELAKMFGAEQGHRYVNAVLDRIAHRLRSVEIDSSLSETS
jgi:N utilization substance protein B